MRLFGVTIPDKKRLDIGLTALYGVGRSRASRILTEANVDPARKPAQVSEAEEARIRTALESLRLEGELRREISGNIKRLRESKAYRGIRHIRHLPVRGQRTKTNSRTVRGNVRKTMGSGRKKAEKK
jgi:small subunit ribosomal protein S13